MKISNLIIVVILLVVCFSCEDIEDKHREYLTETVYPGKADSLRAYIGIEKVYLAWNKPTDAKAERMVVKYGTDSIVSETIIDTIVLSGLDSGDTYNFQVFSLDVNNNQSVKVYADLFPVSQDWINKNMMLAKPQISLTDGINVSSLTFSWNALNNGVMQYKDELEFILTDEQGNEITSDVSAENNVTDGRLAITASNLDINKSYTLSYKMSFSPKIDHKVILDTTPLMGEITFVPDDFSLAPIYLLVESNGWNESSFITLTAIEPGKFIAKNISLIEGDVFRAFEEASLSSEKQFGFSYFKEIPSFVKVSDDGNDNLQLTSKTGIYDLIFETTSKALSALGTYDGLIQIPGTLEAENYNLGGQNIAYNDGDVVNRGGVYRDEGVDISGGPIGNFNVGWTGDGEWLSYTVELLETASYRVDFSVASPRSAVGQLVLKFDEIEKLVFQAEVTGGWNNYVTQPSNQVIELEAGIYQLKVEMRNPNLNLNAIIFTKI